jgi:flagellar biogenesis protein FliO
VDAFQQFFIVGAVMIAFASALYALQRRGIVRFAGGGFKPRADRKMQMVERLQLTPQHALCLVRLEDRTLLIGTAPSSCTLLNTLRLNSGESE